MHEHTDEAEYFRNIIEAEANEETSGEGLVQWDQIVKDKLFGLFFRLNMHKVNLSIHYYIIMIVIESFQLMSLVMVDGTYNQMGPYMTTTPWNLDQIQWLIDAFWAFRIDRYFRISFIGFIVLVSFCGFMIVSTIALGVLLACDKRSNTLYDLLTKLLKLLINLQLSWLFIPIVDSFAFGIRCSMKSGTECLDLPVGFLGTSLYVVALAIYLAIVMLCTLLYYDFCQICGGIMAKPHPRISLLRLCSIVAVIFSSYFIEVTWKVVIFLVICLILGVTQVYVFTQYIPYFNSKMSNLRLAAQVSFTSAACCMIVSEFFKSTDQPDSSISLIYYSLTPCLIQMMHLAMAKRGKLLSETKLQDLTNPFQIEIKARLLIQQLDAARSKNIKSLHGEADDTSISEDFEITENRVRQELEALFNEGFLKFPNSECLYIWSGQVQLHIFKNYILAMVQCFKGLLLANKIDTQYCFYHFRRTSESFYKANMKDDAYDYVRFEKCLGNAHRNDEAVTRSQFFFWTELESKKKITFLRKLSGETAKLIPVAKSNYQRLLKLNSKSSQALRMYGHFLTSLNNFSDIGHRYLQKAEHLEEAQTKVVNAGVINVLTQPLSFFDSDNLIISVSGDFESIGEIVRVNPIACSLLGYLQGELLGQNISMIIPQPFAKNHNEYMRQYHVRGTYSVVDNSSLVLYFANKGGHIFEARLLVKVVPSADGPPYFMAIIKPTNPAYEVILMNAENIITGYTHRCSDYFALANVKSSEQKISTILPRFEELKEEMASDQGYVMEHRHEKTYIKVRYRLAEVAIGKFKTSSVKVEILGKSDQSTDKLDPITSLGPQKLDVLASSSMQSLTVSNKLKEMRGNSLEVKGQSSSRAMRNSVLSSSYYESGYSSYDKYSYSNRYSYYSEYEYESDELERADRARIEELSEESDLVQSLIPSKFSGLKYEEPGPLWSSEGTGLSSLTSESMEGNKLGFDKSKSLQSKTQSSSSGQNLKIVDSSSSEKSYQHDDYDAPSAHSSSKSMTSSMGSLAQFNKSIKALVSYEFYKTNKHVLRFKIALTLTISVLIVTSVMTFNVVTSSVTFNQDLSHFINQVGDLRLNTQSLAYYARQISLIDSSFTSAESRDELFGWLLEDVVDMHDTNLLLYDQFSLLNHHDQHLYFEEDISNLIMDAGTVREGRTNLFDSTSIFILHGLITHGELKDSLVSLGNRRVFYLYSNGNGETLTYLNKTSEGYVRTAEDDLKSQQLTAILLIVGSIVLLICCTVFALGPAIRTIEKSRQELWEILFESPAFVSRVMKAKCSDRLTLLNDTNHIEVEDLKNEDVQDSDEDKSEENGLRSERSDRNKKSEERRKREERKPLTYDPRQRKVIVLKLACFFVFSVVYFYLIYYIGYDSVGAVLQEAPDQVNWASRRKQLTRAVNMWVNEALLSNVAGLGHKYVLPAGQSIDSPMLYAAKMIDELEFVEQNLVFGNNDVGVTYIQMRSKAHDALLFEDACSSPLFRSKSDCASIYNQAMMQGLHSAVALYISLARSLLVRIRALYARGEPTYSEVQAFYHSEDMKLLRELDSHYLYDPLKESSQLYEDDSQELMKGMRVWQDVLLSLYVVLSVLLFFFVYNPMINRLGKETRDSWSMCTLIPQEYAEEFKKLNVAIKERRDNFKWK
jgi:PAS domain S-box-containing protein